MMIMLCVYGSTRTKEDVEESRSRRGDQEGEVKGRDLEVWGKRNAVLDKSMAAARMKQEEGE